MSSTTPPTSETIKEPPTVKPLYAAIAVARDAGLGAYGPYADHPEAEWASDYLGMMSGDGVIATRVIALTPQQPSIEDTILSAERAGVTSIPDPLAKIIIEHADRAGYPSSPESMPEGPAVVILITDERRLTVLIGPFPSPASAIVWINSAITASGQQFGAENGGHRAELHIVALQNLQPVQRIEDPAARESGVGRERDEDIDLPAVVVLEIDKESGVAYGPFPDTLLAATYWHHITSILEFTNVDAVHILPVHPPSTAAEDHPEANAGPSATTSPAHLVITSDPSGGELTATGWFFTEEAAKAWAATQTFNPATTVIILPVGEP